MQTEEKNGSEPDDAIGAIGGGMMTVIGCAIIYTGLGFAGHLTRLGLDFANLFTWFAKSNDPFWERMGGGGVSIGIIVLVIGLLLIASTKRRR